MIDKRRLEMLGDRVEGACAGHKVFARVWFILPRRGRVTMLVSTLPAGYDLRQIKTEIELTLGMPVTVYRDAVKVEVLHG